MDTTNEINTLIQGAERAVDQQRFELAQALAAIAQARALADIANALRDDGRRSDKPAERVTAYRKVRDDLGHADDIMAAVAGQPALVTVDCKQPGREYQD